MPRSPQEPRIRTHSPGFTFGREPSLAILLPLGNNPFKTSALSRLVIWPLIPESPERAAAGQSR